jgi:hypothetical protein
MKSSNNLSFPTHSRAVGKCSWKKASASERVRNDSMLENGAKRVRVNDPSWRWARISVDYGILELNWSSTPGWVTRST